MNEPRLRYFRCACCGDSFKSSKPPDPERDVGFGHCDRCHEGVAKSWVKYGFASHTSMTMDEAMARLAKYA